MAQTAFLSTLIALWKEHTVVMQMIRDVLLYFVRMQCSS